jgi:hypothetical protein
MGLAGSAAAGPPYVTDDPVPTDRGRWEVYGFASGTRASGVTEGAAGVDANYGAADDLQLTLVVPIAFERGNGARSGLGDVELAAKYRFLHQAEGSLAPDMAFFPKVSLPSGRGDFSEGHATLFLPIWAQKDFGPWSVFGGGGYHLRPGRNVWLTGLAATRSAGERLSIGGEVFHETPDEPGARAYTGMNLGMAYRLSERWSFLASGGPSLQNRSAGKFNLYVSLKADY